MALLLTHPSLLELYKGIELDMHKKIKIIKILVIIQTGLFCYPWFLYCQPAKLSIFYRLTGY
jgi:hypothetical protein